MTNKLSITYSSWPLLWSGEHHLSTLAVFYDEIWLPHAYGLSPDADLIYPNSADTSDILKDAQAEYQETMEKYAELSSAGILKVLPPADIPANAHESLVRQMNKLQPLTFGLQEVISGGYIPSLEIANGLLAASVHLLYASKPSTELFLSTSNDHRTEKLAGYLVDGLFGYRVPLLADLTSEQILEVREYLKDTKQGFAAHLCELTDDVESRLGSDNVDEIAAALKTIERKLLPQYQEFQRQLMAKNVGFWSSVPSRIGAFLKTDAAPWTPKFYGALIEILIGSMSDIAKEKLENLSNQKQAFYYLARLEKFVDKLP